MASKKDLADYEKNRPAPDYSGVVRRNGLRCVATRNQIVIRIGVDALKVALENNPDLWNAETGEPFYRVLDAEQFAKEVVCELNNEDPDTGNSPVALMLDDVMKKVIWSGTQTVAER